jgi:hypothetical protein
MSTKNDYSADQWKAISGAPVAAGLYITLSDASGPIGIAKEAMAVGKAITESASGNAPDIVKALGESVKAAGGRPEVPDVPKTDRAQMKVALIGSLQNAIDAVAAKSPSEADAFKRWLLSVASKVAHASKEGGFLGIGGIEVSTEEQEALNQLASALGSTGRSITT